MTPNVVDAKRQARDLLDQSPDARKVLETVEKFKEKLQFGAARYLLANIIDRFPGHLALRQQLALCTYKDEDRLPQQRLEEALEILEALNLRKPDKADAETLRLGGAIYKRLWEHTGSLEFLYEAKALYLAGYHKDPDEDQGYGGVNAALILDILAARAKTIARRNGLDSDEGTALAKEARALRQDMKHRLVAAAEQHPQHADSYWFAATLAEVHFGLQEYTEAEQWLNKAHTAHPLEWERQSTFRQLVFLARMQDQIAPRDDEPLEGCWKVLCALLENDEKRTRCALSCARGKVGLALSGGGFRASLFHLGVLARLAEMDVLRSVEALSTVSGGSIVGAHYYLEVQKLLKEKTDQNITRDDYINIVQWVIKDFLAGVQRNMRMRMLANPLANFRMLFSDRYTTSHRLGELYDREIYSRVQDSHNAGFRRMSELLIQPLGESANFSPKFSNWRRRAKVPVLLLNATSLNTGHAWQFTARWMGEPPGLLGDQVDKNQRLRRMYYEQTPSEDHQHYQLGHAVAASACVPGLFDPLVLKDLYKEDYTVRLVDGGVHDNQGVAGLLDEGVSMILCSDAAGHMDDVKSPSGDRLQTLIRTSSVLMDRVREAQYQDLAGRVDSRALEGLFFIHLKQDLSSQPVDWIGCQDPSPAVKNKPVTDYGIAPDLQRLLAGIRTDLDAFSDVEAYALMLSGYKMTEYQFNELQKEYEKHGEKGNWGGFDITTAQRKDWLFLALEELMGQKSDSKDPRRHDLKRQLEAGSSLFLRLAKLDSAARWFGIIVLAVILFLLVYLVYMTWNMSGLSGLTVGALVVTVIMVMLGGLFPATKWLQPMNFLKRWLWQLGLATVGAAIGNFGLLVDCFLLKRGSLERLLEHKD